MFKVIRQILALLWKVVRLVLWKWLKPRLAKIFVYTVAAIGLIVLVAVLLFGR